MHGINPQDAPEVGIKDLICYTVPEAAEQLRVTPRYVQMLIERGELPSFKFGSSRQSSRRVRATDLQAYVDSLVEEERAVRERARSAA